MNRLEISNIAMDAQFKVIGHRPFLSLNSYGDVERSSLYLISFVSEF